MDDIYILDAVNFLFRSYYAIGPMTNDEGASTSALYGFIRSLQKIIKEFSPSHLVAVFDGPDNTKARKAVYSEYKMNRKGAPEDLLPQFIWAHEFCELAGIPALCINGVEADDTMASIAVWAEKNQAKTFICTSDKDMCQLVSENIFILNTHKNNLLIDSEKVEEIYGIRPNQMLDFLAMTGDASDNIPGLPGIGPKTASALLNQFDDLDTIFASTDQLKGKKREIFETEKEQAILSKNLATLKYDVEIPTNTDFYKIQDPNLASLEKFYRKMKFITLLKDLEPETPTPKEEKTLYLLINQEKELKQFIKALKKETEICFDTETTSVKPLQAELVGISFCAREGKAAYIPFNGAIDPVIILKEIEPLFRSECIHFCGHNVKYDLHVLKNYGIQVRSIYFDTILASYLLHPQNRRHNLDQLVLEKYNKHKISIKELIGDGKKQISMKDVPIEKVSNYCCEDADYTLRLKNLFEKELKEEELDQVFETIEIPLLPVLAKMERNGIFLDVTKLNEMSVSLDQQIHKVSEKIYESAGTRFNLNSPKQLSEVLFQRLGLKEPTRKKTEYSTGAKVLEMLAQENSVASDILEYRGLEKLRSTYVNALPKEINPQTDRIHPTFNQSVTATGRLSCQDPNLQNIPVRSDEGRKIREGFRPQKKGWVYLSADYAQIELRLLAHLSEDPKLIEAFQNNEDIHTFTASLVHDIPIEEVTPQMRRAAKAVNFGILYGQSAYGLAQELGISNREAAQFIHTYFERYPKVSSYITFCKEQVKKTGYAVTLTGRKRPIPEIESKNPHIRAAADRLAVNTPLQGSNADIIKLAMIAIDQEIQSHKLNGFMILQIHDELLFEIPESEQKIFERIVKEKMENVVSLKIPLTVDIKVGKNWGQC